jgi:chromosomal replication initiation ATPase DnaA
MRRIHYNQRRKTLQHTQARIVSRFGWGLTKKIENHGLSRFKAHMQRVWLHLIYRGEIYSASVFSLVKE